MWTAYRKLIVAVVGVLILLLSRHTGIDLSAQEQLLVDAVVGGLTAFGVWRAPNDPTRPV